MTGVTAHPTGAWVVQQARNLAYELTERAQPVKFLIRDRDTKFTGSFDEIFRSEGVRIIRTPVRAPRANALAERLVGTVQRECVDRMLIVNRRQLEVVLSDDPLMQESLYGSLGAAFQPIGSRSTLIPRLVDDW